MKEAIRKFMVEKAKSIFEKKGFKATTIEDIAKASSISIPTFYNYFPGKKDIFIDVIDSIDNQLDEEILPIFKTDLDFFSKIEQLLEKLIEFVKKNKEIVRIAFFDSEVYSIMNKCTAGDMFKKKESRISNLIILFDEAKKNNIINTNVSSENISLFTMGILHEVFFKIIYKKKDLNTKEITKDILSFLKNGIKK